ncbi:hypothetical protein MLD38_026758 [Melastoma candidum]|uniref:Uncharacterized protein n=1 Tax=Melastoma candidum TaxID=119954 RepID=A0ACB9P1G4_9MYRT|nr:hypothetical protein MLD38_026758 [Melastoma candidum]
MYQFSDFPWPSSVVEEFPDHCQILEYMEEYARQFDLVRHIMFRSKVVSVWYERDADEDEETEGWDFWGGSREAFGWKGKWEVQVETSSDGHTSMETYVVDFVILCIGRFSGNPNFPEFPPGKGPETFHGKVIHSEDYATMGHERAKEFVRGKSVVVVGFRKSALYIAMECSNINASRSRSAPACSTVQASFYNRVEEGSIVLKKALKFEFRRDGISIDGKLTEVKADVVIMATGFKGDQKLSDIFESQSFRNCILRPPSAVVSLYRECIHPQIPQFAVIGFSKNLSNLYTFEMHCRWLVELLAGKFRLTPICEMEKDMEEWENYLESSGKGYRKFCQGALHIWNNDQMCKDMGWNQRRKTEFFLEWFEPYGPSDYASP